MKPFVESGLIELIPFYFKTRSYIDGVQIPAYHDCIYKHKQEVEWLGILDTDEFFMLAPTSPHFLLTDFLKTVENYTDVCFPTAFFAYQGGNVSIYMENCKNPSFINDWLLMADENKKREPKSIYRADSIEYINVHVALGFYGEMLRVEMKDAFLGHFRYPYKNYTIEGLNTGIYQRKEYYRIIYGTNILENLHQLGFTDYKVNCIS